MRFLSVRDLKAMPGQVWTSPDEDEIVVTSNGKPVALLTKLDETTLERELELRRRTRALLVLERAQREAELTGAAGLSNEDIQKEIQAVRAHH